MSAYISESDLKHAIKDVHGTAHHLLKIWFVLKQMGLSEKTSVSITTSNSTDALKRLFSYGDSDGKFYIPFAHTKRFETMMHDASRSIIQTTIQRWNTSGSVVEVDPTNFLSITKAEDGSLIVRQGRNYPQGLGYGQNGFALEDNARIKIPDVSFAVWYFRFTELSDDCRDARKLVEKMKEELNLSNAEMAAIFVADSFTPRYSDSPLSEEQVNQIVTGNEPDQNSKVIIEDYTTYMTQISNLTTVNDKPKWLNLNPAEEFKGLLENGEKNILLYGPPRTGKTYVVRNTVPKEESVTIQMHDGWTYEDLVLGLTPVNGDWEYRKGPLLQSILDHKKYIILEEINRTDFAQAIGDVFTLIESGYRDGRGSVVLKDGTSLTIPSDITFIFTMNTLDKSVTIIDDALFGRVASVEFPPMVEELENLLQKNEVDEDTRSKIRDIFNIINASYPMGHAFFVDYKGGDDFIAFYSARIRPVLQKHLENLRQQELSTIDEKVDQSFNQ